MARCLVTISKLWKGNGQKWYNNFIVLWKSRLWSSHGRARVWDGFTAMVLRYPTWQTVAWIYVCVFRIFLEDFRLVYERKRWMDDAVVLYFAIIRSVFLILIRIFLARFPTILQLAVVDEWKRQGARETTFIRRLLRISLQIHIFRNIVASVIMKLVEEETSTLCIEIFRKIHDPLTRNF